MNITKLIFFGFWVFFLSSCNSWIGAPYTSPLKIIEVEKDMSIKEVNNALGVPAYNVLHLNSKGSTLLSYKYRKQFRRKIVYSDEQMHNEESQKSGSVWYKNPSNLYVFFHNDKMRSLVTDAGFNDSEALMIDNNAIQAISKDNIDFYMMAKNETVRDSSFGFDIKSFKLNGKVTVYQIIRIKKDTELKVLRRSMPAEITTTKIRKTRSLPSYSKPKTVSEFKNNISMGFIGYTACVNYERSIYTTGKFNIGAGAGMGYNFVGRGLGVPLYAYAGLTFNNVHSVEYQFGITPVLGLYRTVIITPALINYRLGYKRFLFKIGVGIDIFSGNLTGVLPSFCFGTGVRF